jgi:hypothetical protein
VATNGVRPVGYVDVVVLVVELAELVAPVVGHPLRHGGPEDPQLDAGRDLEEHRVVVDRLDRAVDPTRGDDLVAGLEGRDDGLMGAQAPLLGADEHDPHEAEHEHEGEEGLHGVNGAPGMGPGRG